MSKSQSLRRARRLQTLSESPIPSTRSTVHLCEVVESRVMLSATFATPVTVSVPGAEAPMVVDRFDGSSNPYGLAVATPTAVQILSGGTNGAFTLGQSIPLPADPAAISPFESGDFSGSGTIDIALDSHNAGTGDGEITYETNNGAGSFTAGTVTPITDGGAGFTPISGRAADFNGDGETDLAIVGKPGTGSELVLAVMLSNGIGGFTETDYPIAGSNAAGSTSNEEIFTGITNEICVYDGSSGNLDVFSGTGNGIFTQLTPVPITATLMAEGSFDDNEDLIVANGDQLLLLVNQGDGTFQPDPQGPITLGGPINAMAVGQFALSGNNDIITNQGILFGNGDGTFVTPAQALPATINGGNNVVNTLQAVFLGHSKQGFVGFSSAGNALVSVVNTTLAPVSVDTNSNNNPANPGSDVQLTADVSPLDSNITATPTGTVTFFDNGTDNLGTATLSDGSATLDIGSSLSGANNSITATYNGDANFATGVATAFTQTVLSPTVTTVTSSENPSVSGDDVIFTATVTGNDGAGDVPTGDVEFFDNGVELGDESLDSTGATTYDTTGSLAVGSHPITAQYSGDSNYSTSQSAVFTQTVNQPSLAPNVASTTLPTEIVAGARVHGTVTVTLANETGSAILLDQITVFASTTDDTVNATPLIAKSYEKALEIPAGQTKFVKFTINPFPQAIGSGTYKLLAQATTSLSQTINAASGPSVTVAAPFVNLITAANTGKVMPNPVKAGKSVTVTINLDNSGNITTGLATLNIGLSTDDQTETTTIETTVAHISIKPGHTGVLRVHFKIPATTAAGLYYPFVSITDEGDVVTVIGQVFTVEV